MSDLIAPCSVIAFWKEAGADVWYKKDADFDARFRDRFFDAHMAAAGRLCDHWMQSAQGALALLILLDQYPRNSFRGTAHQFSTDALALGFARKAISLGYLQELESELQQFILMPLMHSEALADQDDLILLCTDLPDTLKFAHIHRDIILRFDRFPHRNLCLGRDTTPEEQHFLDEGGFRG